MLLFSEATVPFHPTSVTDLQARFAQLVRNKLAGIGHIEY
jgi:hypothetical protein